MIQFKPARFFRGNLHRWIHLLRTAERRIWPTGNGASYAHPEKRSGMKMRSANKHITRARLCAASGRFFPIDRKCENENVRCEQKQPATDLTGANYYHSKSAFTTPRPSRHFLVTNRITTLSTAGKI